MENILETEVSLFANYTSPKPFDVISLYHWLTNSGYKQEINRLRKFSNKGAIANLKKQLPAITPSGIFEGRRNADKLVKHSGFMCVDVDGKENLHITDWEAIKNEMAKVRNVAYCGLSASGNGIYMIIPIATPNNHAQHFNALECYFLFYHNIRIDKACKDVCRLRGVSYDANPVLNSNAEPMTACLEVPNKASLGTHSGVADVTLAQSVLKQILSLQTDVTETYADWLSLGCAIANTLGKDGRDIYHDISSMSAKYKKRDCDRQYDACLKHRYPYSVGTLIYIYNKYKP